MVDRLLCNPDIDVVAAFQETRHEGALLSWYKKWFYRIFMQASGSDIVANASDFRVFRRCVADAILGMPEYHRFSKGIFAWIGFKTETVPYTAASRHAGTTKWTTTKLFRYAFSGIASFSSKPLSFIASLGIITSAIAVIYALVLIVRTLIMGIDVPGYASLLAAILLLGGAQLLSLGIVGAYLARTYDQGKQRPHYIVRRHINPASNATGSSEGVIQ